MSRRVSLAILLVVVASILGVVVSVLLWWPDALAQPTAAAAPALDPSAWGWGLLAAALATGLSSIGAAYAVATVGSAMVGAVAEKPELFGRLLIVVGLAEGIAIYGIIISILILNRLV